MEPASFPNTIRMGRRFFFWSDKATAGRRMGEWANGRMGEWRTGSVRALTVRFRRTGTTGRGLCRMAAVLILFSGCGHDSYVTDPDIPQASVEFGDGIEIFTPTDTLIRYFEDFTPASYQDRPAVELQELIGGDIVTHTDLYGYRLIGVDGFYANQPGKEYGDNTWDQLGIGWLDLMDIKVIFETERDPTLKKGHNVKWLIRVEVLRSIDVVWPDGRMLAAVREVEPVTVPDGFPGAGAEGIVLASFVERADPSDLEPEDYFYRVTSEDGTRLPRLLTWEEMHETYYLSEEDRVVMSEVLGPAYRIDLPRTIELEASR